MRTRVLVAAMLAASLAIGCGGGREPNTPVVMTIDRARPYIGFEAALSTLRMKGYRIEDVDPYRFFIRARAKVDAGGYSYSWGKARSTSSYFNVLAYSDGSVSITADGHLVADDGRTMHRKLSSEMHSLANAIFREAERIKVQGLPPPDYRPNAPPEAAPPTAPTMPVAPPPYVPPPGIMN